MEKKRVRNLVLSAVMVGLSVVLGLFTLNFSQNLQIGINSLPIHAVGFLLGPFWGALAGFIEDVFTMIKYGSFISFFTVSAIISGLVPGIAYLIFKDKLYKSVALIAVTLLITLSLSTVFNTIGLYTSYGTPMDVLLSKAILVPKLIAILIKVILYTTIFRAILPISNKMLNRE